MDKIVLSSDSPLSWLHTSPLSVKISFLQGLFERTAKVDNKNRSVSVTTVPIHAPDVFRLLIEVGVQPSWFSRDPPIIRVRVEDAAGVPLFNPIIMSDNFKRVLALSKK